MAFGDADLLSMLEGPFSEPIVYGTGNARGLFLESTAPSDYGAFMRDPMYLRTDGVDVAQQHTHVDVYAPRLATGGPLAGLREDDAITVAGRSWRVRAFGPIEDGRIVRIRLAEA